jgi:hypothetical protein
MPSFLQLFHRPPVRRFNKPAVTRWPLYVAVILAIWISFALYADTLGLPFLQEDSTHIRWLSWHTVLEPFLTAKGAPDFRPLGKSILKIWYLILGRHDRVWLRTHNFAFNTLNIALIAVLATWVDTSKRRYWTGAIAALLFGAFPFAYQAIPWINNFFYPLANLLLLAMTAVYWQARVRDSNGLLLLAFLLLFLAPFEIEYGLMGSSLMLTVELVLWLQKRQPYPWLTGPLVGLLLNLLFLFRSLTIPKQSYSFGLPTPGRLLLISTYFLQGLMYPISPLAIWVMKMTGWGDVAAIWLVSIPALIVILVVLLRKRQGGLVLFSLLWFFLLNLPALIFVDFDYVVNSPRLLYPPGVGIVILWGGFLAILAVGERQPRLRFAGAALLVLLILGMSARFIRERNEEYLLAQEPVLQLVEIAKESDADEELIVVNFPSWLAPKERRFAMGNHGVQIIPFYINIQELIYAHNDADQAAQAIQFGNIRQPMPYYYGMLGEQVDYEKLGDKLRSGNPVYLTQWGPEEIYLSEVGRAGSGSIDPGQEVFTFNEQVRLQPLSITIDETLDEDTLSLKLLWEIEEPVEDDVTVFVHLYGADDELIEQADGYPIGGMAPFWLWEVGETLEDFRSLSLPADSALESYNVGIGLYKTSTGERLPVVDKDGQSLANDVVLLPLSE